MKMTAATRAMKTTFIHNLWTQGERHIQTIANDVQVSPAFVRKTLREQGHLSKQPAGRTQRVRKHLSEEQLHLLKASLPENAKLLQVRAAIREMFGLELYDVTVRRYMHEMTEGPRAALGRGRSSLLNPAQYGELQAWFLSNPTAGYLELKTRLMTMTNQTPGTSTVYKYLKQLRSQR